MQLRVLFGRWVAALVCWLRWHYLCALSHLHDLSWVVTEVVPVDTIPRSVYRSDSKKPVAIVSTNPHPIAPQPNHK